LATTRPRNGPASSLRQASSSLDGAMTRAGGTTTMGPALVLSTDELVPHEFAGNDEAGDRSEQLPLSGCRAGRRVAGLEARQIMREQDDVLGGRPRGKLDGSKNLGGWRLM
jgi:hypothetical protein